MTGGQSKKDYYVRIPARFLKNPEISSDAKALLALIGAYADGHTRLSYVQPKTLDCVLRWGRRRRERAQTELAQAGWLRLRMKRGARGVWSRRVYEICEPSTIAHFERSGERAQLILSHGQSQVKSSLATNLNDPGHSHLDVT